MARIRESSIERTAKLLAAQHNIKVVFQPGTVSTKPGVITLPTIPDTASQELVDAMQGYLDQQAGYVLFSDLHQVEKLRIASNYNAQEQQLYDVFKSVEDSRIEEKMEMLYPGCRYNFHNAQAFLFNQLKNNFDKLSPFRQVISAAYLQRRQPHTEFWNALSDEVKQKAEKVNELVKEEDPADTQQSFSTAQKIIVLFKQEAGQDQQQRQQEQKASGQPKAGQDTTTDDKGGTSLSGIMQQAMAAAANEQTKEAVSLKPRNASGAPKAGNEGYQHNLKAEPGYTIYTTKYDEYLDAKLTDLSTDGAYLAKLREETMSVTGVMRKRLVNSLRAIQRSKWLTGRPEGRLDVRKAYKAIHGISDNVYKTKTDKIKLDTAVALAIDHSGSMHGRQLELAAEAAIVLGDVFDPLRIPFMVYGFSTNNGREWPNDHHLYARWGALWILHYKRFEESWKHGSLKLTGARNNTKNNTLDGESVLYGIRALLDRPEKRKILFVFNDGGPYPGNGDTAKCQVYLKSVVAQATAMGVEVICFGINTDEVKNYYPKWVRINGTEDLIKEPLKQIDELLRKGLVEVRK